MRGRVVLITGCSGGGKSTLIAALARAGFATLAEPGRRIVRRALVHGDRALPWDDPAAFARACIATALADLRQCRARGLVFADRGLPDAVSALEALGAAAPRHRRLVRQAPYARLAFLAPPWPALFATDRERRHGFDAAVAEYERLARDLPRWGFRPVILPKRPVAARLAFVRNRLSSPDAWA